jgi:aspartate aminotransferase-like enzyme
MAGPSVHQDLLDAMAGAGAADEAEIGRRTAAMQPALGDLFRTRGPVLLAASSPAGFLEAGMRCGIRERVLAVIGGRDGERLAALAEACGKEVFRAHVPDGATLEPRHLARFLDGPAVDAVALAHVEGSTGAAAPLADLAHVVRARPDVMLLVDATGSLGAEPVETDAWGLDLVVCGSDGPLGLPAGLALTTASDRLLARARGAAGRGWHLDLVRLDAAARDGVAADALPWPLLSGLERQLGRIAERGGIAARWQRQAALRDAVSRWLEANPSWSPVARESRRASAMTVLRPAGAAAAAPAPAAVELRHPPDATADQLDRALAGIADAREFTPPV